MRTIYSRLSQELVYSAKTLSLCSRVAELSWMLYSKLLRALATNVLSRVPAPHRLSIEQWALNCPVRCGAVLCGAGDLFMVVYSVDSRETFEEALRLRDEVVSTIFGQHSAGGAPKWKHCRYIFLCFASLVPLSRFIACCYKVHARMLVLTVHIYVYFYVRLFASDMSIQNSILVSTPTTRNSTTARFSLLRHIQYKNHHTFS